MFFAPGMFLEASWVIAFVDVAAFIPLCATAFVIEGTEWLFCRRVNFLEGEGRLIAAVLPSWTSGGRLVVVASGSLEWRGCVWDGRWPPIVPGCVWRFGVSFSPPLFPCADP